jgi:serine protease Do
MALESDIQAINKAIQQEGTISTSSKQELQESVNRSNVIANSQASSLTAAVAEVAPAVVSIVVSQDVPQLQVTYVDPFGNDPFFQGSSGFQIPEYTQTGSTTRQEVAAGTGFLIRSDGYILTNKHVVAEQDAYYTVLLSTGKQEQAKVVYRDPNNDVAIVKIDGSGYPVATFGDSSALQLGETVAAIGNALGKYNNSVSVGVISGLDRTIEASDENGNSEQLSGVIQTDAAINPGNSGGPLFDLSGKVVGVNVATTQGANNVSFSIPINEISGIVSKVLP